MLDKVMLKNVVNQGISQMPSEVIVKRERLDTFNEPTGSYETILDKITGLIYRNDYRGSNHLKDKGEVEPKEDDVKFLVVYDENSIKIKKGDILELNQYKKYKVLKLNDYFEVYFDMVVEELC